jgi:hypothetical protein
MTATTNVDTTAASLQELLRARASAKDIERHLDALPPAARVQEVLAITGRGVKHLYEAVADAPSVTLEEIVPANAGSSTVIFEGRNSLPLFTRFQKRFARLGDGTIVGYNHQTMSFFTGPGYFLVKAPSGEGEHGKELLFDYTVSPASEPSGWPAFRPNDRGLSRLVYGNMKDYVRRVARGVIVGKAYKLGVDQKAYFSLSLPE